jgi:hypothetical protein
VFQPRTAGTVSWAAAPCCWALPACADDIAARRPWRLSFGKRFALGVAYNDVEMKVAADDYARFRGLIDAGCSGALLCFKVDFGTAPQ